MTSLSSFFSNFNEYKRCRQGEAACSGGEGEMVAGRFRGFSDGEPVGLGLGHGHRALAMSYRTAAVWWASAGKRKKMNRRGKKNMSTKSLGCCIDNSYIYK